MFLLESGSLSFGEWVPIITGSGGALVILCIVSWKLWKRLEKRDADLDANHKSQMDMLILVNKEGDELFQKQIESMASVRRALEQLNISLQAVTKILEAQNGTLEDIRKNLQSAQVSLGIIQGHIHGNHGGSSPDIRG